MLAVSSPAATYRLARTSLFALAPVGFALAFFAAFGITFEYFFDSSFLLLLGVLPDLFVPLALCLGSVLVGRRLAGRLGVPLASLSWPRWQRTGLVVAQAAAVQSALTLCEMSDLQNAAMVAMPVAGGALFAAAVAFAQLLPPKPVPHGVRPARLGGVLRPKLAALPLLPALALFFWLPAQSLQLKPIPGGAPAFAEQPGGSLIAIGGGDGIVRIYDTATASHTPLQRIALGPAAVSSLALRGPGPWLHPLRSIGFGPRSFVTDFRATTAGSDFSRSCIIGYGLIGLPDADRQRWPTVEREISQFPCEQRPYVPGVYDHARPIVGLAIKCAPCRVAFPTYPQVRRLERIAFAARYPARTSPHRRFTHALSAHGAGPIWLAKP